MTKRNYDGSDNFWEERRREHKWLCRTCKQWVKERIGKQCRECRRGNDEGNEGAVEAQSVNKA